MQLNNFIKQNLALTLGIALPVVLMVCFMLAAAIPNMMTPPPKYNVLFSVSAALGNGDNQVPLNVTLRVQDHRLVATYKPRKKNTQGQYDFTTWRKLYLYDVKTQTVTPLDFPLPDDAGSISKTETRPVESAKDLTLSDDVLSPDGYAFAQGDFSGGGFMGDLFWSGSRYRGPQLVKGGAHVSLKLNPPAYYSYYDASFIGWVTPAQKE